MITTNLPISYQIPRNQGMLIAIEHWLMEVAFNRFTFDWITNVITFEYEDDAIAFQLKFGIERYETTLEKMIRNEE